MATFKIKRFSSRIEIRKPHIEIRSSQSSSSSSYDSEDPENNYHYESSGDYYDNSDQDGPDGYEEETIETPEASLRSSRSTDDDQSFKNKVEKILEEKSGMSKKEVLGKLGLSAGGMAIGTILGEKLKERLKDVNL